jgi:hypothetical protein
MKKCYKCKLEKTFDDFHVSSSSKDGRQHCCKMCKSVMCNRFYKNNAASIKDKTSTYYYENKDKRVNWENAKYQSDPLFKLKKRLRHRLRSAFYRLKKHKTRGSAIKGLGCTINELKNYLESKWEPGMSWGNWTSDGWHIDHIIPLSAAKDENEMVRLCHYTNLQPLWAIDNIRKGGIM